MKESEYIMTKTMTKIWLKLNLSFEDWILTKTKQKNKRLKCDSNFNQIHFFERVGKTETKSEFLVNFKSV